MDVSHLLSDRVRGSFDCSQKKRQTRMRAIDATHARCLNVALYNAAAAGQDGKYLIMEVIFTELTHVLTMEVAFLCRFFYNNLPLSLGFCQSKTNTKSFENIALEKYVVMVCTSALVYPKTNTTSI